MEVKERFLRLVGWTREDDTIPQDVVCRYCGGGTLPAGTAPVFTMRSGRRVRLATNLKKMGGHLSREKWWYRHARPEACSVFGTIKRNRTRGPLARLVWDVRNRVAA